MISNTQSDADAQEAISDLLHLARIDVNLPEPRAPAEGCLLAFSYQIGAEQVRLNIKRPSIASEEMSSYARQ
jgi:hypothetical protein